eukprot:scaffold1167_cov154-Isochrysis_galbana.AAC.7
MRCSRSDRTYNYFDMLTEACKYGYLPENTTEGTIALLSLKRRSTFGGAALAHALARRALATHRGSLWPRAATCALSGFIPSSPSPGTRPRAHHGEPHSQTRAGSVTPPGGVAHSVPIPRHARASARHTASPCMCMVLGIH